MKFSIRDLMLVTVIVALAVGWVMDRIRAERLEIRVQEAAEAAESIEAASKVILRHLASLEKENSQVRTQAEVGDDFLAIEKEVSEIHRLKTLVDSLNSSSPVPNQP
jgi:hypothetical protein